MIMTCNSRRKIHTFSSISIISILMSSLFFLKFNNYHNLSTLTFILQSSLSVYNWSKLLYNISSIYLDMHFKKHDQNSKKINKNNTHPIFSEHDKTKNYDFKLFIMANMSLYTIFQVVFNNFKSSSKNKICNSSFEVILDNAMYSCPRAKTCSGRYNPSFFRDCFWLSLVVIAK